MNLQDCCVLHLFFQFNSKEENNMLEKSLRGHVHSSKVDGGVFIAMMSKKNGYVHF